MQNQELIELPRGGYLVDTSAGYIQFGSPPETIKDTMGFEKKTPLIFVLPNKFFHVEKGISTAELEFPIYYNHFLRQKKTTIICSEEQREQLIILLTESVFGPSEINLENEFINGKESYGFPDLKKEMDYFRGNRKLDDLVEFLIFQENEVKVAEVLLRKKDDGGFIVNDNSLEISIPGEVGFNIIYDIGKRLEEPYIPKLLGITCLGPSHGFDPNDNTSGFILWINHHGIMVDPPVNSTEWLRESNVNPKLINNVILTHCHADHDAGTFQKILEEGKITIYATQTVMESFLCKYGALTKKPRKELVELFNYQPIIIGKPTNINGAEFNFFYSLHSIPSTGFEFFFQDQSFVYSSDHLNEPEIHDKLYQMGILTESRYKHIKEFPWDRRIIYHEAGIPPIHTRISYLASLPEEVQKKITVYHISKKDMPDGTNLKLAKFGIENTLEPEITPPKNQEAYNLLDILSQIDIFQGYPIEKAKEFLQIANEEKFKRGELIFKKGSPGDRFFIIASGNVKFDGLSDDPDMPIKRYGQYEYFGEASLILNTLRAADVYAETDVIAITIEKNNFLQFIRGSDLKQNLSKLNLIRDTNSWKTLAESKHFKALTSHQKTQLELIMNINKVKKGDILIQEGEIHDEVYIIREGEVSISSKGVVKGRLSTGDFVGEIFNFTKELPATLTFEALTGLQVYTIERKDLISYIRKNPGVYMRMDTAFI